MGHHNNTEVCENRKIIDRLQNSPQSWMHNWKNEWIELYAGFAGFPPAY